MTAQEAIDRADALLPNTLESAEKLRWLSELDGRLGAELSSLRGEEPPPAPQYGGQSALLAGPPWEGLYLHYLQARILYSLAEYTRYENARSQFNSEYLSFTAAAVRAARPRRSRNLRF